MVQVMLCYRNGTCMPILCAVKGSNGCGYHSQHPCGRMPENLPQILASSRNQVIDQIYSPNLLWCEMSTSFLRTEQTYTWYHNSNTGHKEQTLDLLCANTGMDGCLPSIHAKCKSSFSLHSQKQDLHLEEMSLMVRPQCQTLLAPCIFPWNTMAGLHTGGWRGPFSRRTAEFKVSCAGENVTSCSF